VLSLAVLFVLLLHASCDRLVTVRAGYAARYRMDDGRTAMARAVTLASPVFARVMVLMPIMPLIPGQDVRPLSVHATPEQSRDLPW
jgi:hypothetical protein